MGLAHSPTKARPTMQLILVTGLSGGGKSIAIRQLEDSGCYCVDNLPAEFLLPVAHRLGSLGEERAAIAIDGRSIATMKEVSESLAKLREEGFDVRVLFLTASTDELIKRFSETRRRHPFSIRAEHEGKTLTLREAVELEAELLQPMAEHGMIMDTTGILPAQLRRWVQQFAGEPGARMTITFESFAYKHGIPTAADLVFDVRCIANPYYDPALRPLTGRDEPVARFLAADAEACRMVDDIAAFLETWIPAYLRQNRHYLTICIGCTGGQHRSVWVAETLGRRFADRAGVIVRHRIAEQLARLAPEATVQTA